MDDRNQSPDWLELYQPDRPDPDVPDIASLQQQLQSSGELRHRHRAILDGDSRIGKVLRAVEVPSDLRQSVLEHVAVHSRSRERGWRTRLNRRFWTASVTVLALSLLVVAALFVRPTKEPTFEDVLADAEDVYLMNPDAQSVNTDFRAERQFPPGFLPASFSRGWNVRFIGKRARAIELSGARARCLVIVVQRGAFPDSVSPSGHVQRSQGLAIRWWRNSAGLTFVAVYNTRNLAPFQKTRPIT